MDRQACIGPDAEAAGSMRALFDLQNEAFLAEPYPSFVQRIDRLDRLLEMTDTIAPEMARAISADFGHRSSHVTRLADTMVVRNAALYARRRLAGWMKARRVPTPPAQWPGRSRLAAHPLGVVGIVSPWNYPYQLSMSPAVSALAAGNRVLVKPSELTPRFADLLRQAVGDRFAPDEMAVVTGDAELARAFVSLPFHHLLFTGSTSVGRQVALAAAANLTPLTLELGGKSPAILNADCDLSEAVPRLMAAKLLNTGQTCIAPDYLLVHEKLLEPMVDAMRAATLRLYPTIAGNPDYGSIVSKHHVKRLFELIDDAFDLGASVLPLHVETATVEGRMPPFMLLGTDDRMKVMQEEIFGPLMPVVTYRHLDEAIAFVNARERPLALYWFGRDRNDLHAVLQRTMSGGVTVNDCLWHVAQEALPFGGVGASGHGCYHGKQGFLTFSHRKPVFVQSRWSGTGMMWPPYGRTFERLSRWLRIIG